MIREHLGGVIERMEKARAQALMRAEAAKVQAQAYAEVIEELRRLDGIALADDVLRGRVRELDEDTSTRPAPEVGDLPPSTGDKNQRCTLPPVGSSAGPSLGQMLRDKAAKAEAEAAKSQAQRKGSPPCPLCYSGTIIYRKTGRLICLNEECPNSKTGQESQAPVKGKTEAPPAEPEEVDTGRVIGIGNGQQELGEGTNLAACIAAIRYRAPHWLTTSGILEVVRARLRKDLPETMVQIIGQEMTKQRKHRTFMVPGLQARQVDARRWEYRIAEVSKHEGD
jgi:hypothetical protein